MEKELKQKLYKHCLDYVKNHIEIISSAVSNAQDAANEEDKNSAGDKYETSRALKQRETETFGLRLKDALAQEQLLKSIDISKEYTLVKPGALVYTSIGIFFIAISADEVTIDDEEYCIISPESPIGQVMANRTAGSQVFFREKQIRILEIY